MKHRRSAPWSGSLRMLCVVLCCSAFLPIFARNGQSVRIETERVSIASPTIYEINRRLSPRKRVLAQPGEPGLRIITRSVQYSDNKKKSVTVLADMLIKPPVPAIYQVGVFPHISSRGDLRTQDRFYRARVMTMNASAYTPHPSGGGTGSGRTANGWPAGYGLVAVDPKVIPLGTVLYVEGYGMAIAADKGRAIKGNKIDLCFHSLRDARQFGRRNVKVYLLR